MNSLATNNILDAALGLEFNECSIIAADACKFAEEIGKNCFQEKVLVLPTEPHSDAESQQLKVKLSSVGTSTAMGENVTYCIADPHGTGQLSMLAVLDDGISVPIASFARRNGACDFVQLGSEMTNENIVVTRSEPRAAYVGAISMLLQGKAQQEHFALLEALCNEEWERSKNQHYDMYTKSIYTMMQTNGWNYCSSDADVQLRKLTPNGSSAGIEATQVKKLAFGSTVSPEVLSMHEFAVMQEKNANTFSFGFCARQNSFVCLFESSPNGVFDMREGAELQLLSFEELEMLRGLLACQQSIATEYSVSAKKCRDILKAKTSNSTKAVQDNLHKRFMNSVKVKREHPNIDVDEAVTEYIQHDDISTITSAKLAQLHKVFNDYYAVPQLTETLFGHTSASVVTVAKALSVILFGKVLKMEGGGVLNERKIGTTITSAQVELVCENGPENTVKVQINGRPTSLVDEAYKTLHQNTLAFYKPIPEKDMATIELIHELLQTITLRSEPKELHNFEALTKRRLFGRHR